jgi:hypothetical protein
VSIKTIRHFVGIDSFIADIDRLVERGDLKPIWRKAVRRPEFHALLVKLVGPRP